MKTSIIAATFGLALSVGFGLGQARAQSNATVISSSIRVENHAGYNIRVRGVTTNGTLSSKTMNLGDNWTITVPAAYQWVRLEVDYNNGSSWNSLCSETIKSKAGGKLTVSGTLFNKSCSMARY